MDDDRSHGEARSRDATAARATTCIVEPAVVAVLLALTPLPATPVDLGAWAQRIRQHERWTSVEFRDPFSGQFLVSRAGTEDQRAHATLTFTASPTNACRPEVVIVFERDADGHSDVERAAGLELQIDRRRPETVPVRIVWPVADRFEFVQLEAPLDPRKLAGHGSLKLRNPPAMRATFSLHGFSDAWRTARSICEDFLPLDDDGPGPGPHSPDADELHDV